MRPMDSWLFGGSERLNFGLSDGCFPPFDSTSPTKEMPSEWGMGSSCNADRSENPTFMESGFQGAQEFVLEGSVKDFVENEVKQPVPNSCSSSFLTKSSSGEKEEGSKDSSSIVDPDANDSFIDLKLGRLSEQRILEDSRSSNGVKSFLQQESPIPPKRSRSAGSNGQAPVCQVQGCNMDLSCFKDYYKRHRVCQVHSKTAKVIVKGIQQRFCQQCSRFHLLSEFDDGKRSCRKRLAGHNERRRKPQIIFPSGKSGVVLPYHHGGGNLLETELRGKMPSFFYQSGVAQSGSYESMNWSRLDGLDNSLTGIPMPTFVDEESKWNAMRAKVKEISFVDEDVTLPASTGIYNGYASRLGCGVSASNSLPDVDKGCARASDSNCAPSLLSFQPSNLCSYPLSMPLPQPSKFANDLAARTKPNSTELPLQELTHSVCSSGIDNPGYGQLGSVPCGIKCSGGLVEQQRHFLESSYGGRDAASSQEHNHTVNLLQLSSLLQDAELRKRSLQVRQEFKPFAPLPSL